MTDYEFHHSVDLEFDVDPDAWDPGLALRADPGVTQPPVVLGDEELRILRRGNRIAIARGTPEPVESAELPVESAAYHVPLLFILHAHPECTFSWGRVQVDLGPTPGTTVIDMSPREVQELPMEVESRRVVGLSFKTVASVADLTAQSERATTRTVYVPTLTTSGVGFRKACWDFHPRSGYLHTDQELHLLVSAPAATPVRAELTVRVKASLRGRPAIPLLARARDIQRHLHLAGPRPD
ncbi:hypothetical protein ACWD25_23415 [Streptomyces sp. NPDC002920]